MMEYRFSKNRPEIIKSLESKLTEGSQITVWQKNNDGSRCLLEKVLFHTLYVDEGVFTLKMAKKDFINFEPKKPIYFLFEDHEFVFKTSIAIDQKEFMTLQIPREVRLKEFRVHERKYYTMEDKKFIEVVFVGKNSGPGITLTCPLVNVSVGGACIVVSKETISNIDFTAILKLKFSTEYQNAIIRNARVYIKKNLFNDDLYAIGVQFDDLVPTILCP
ncbi:MAG: hypothetical protein Q7U04_10280 [Bacteriovorax sp.]|nr:hypothetical protein [Bacteriovorax sp.]